MLCDPDLGCTFEKFQCIVGIVTEKRTVAFSAILMHTYGVRCVKKHKNRLKKK